MTGLASRLRPAGATGSFDRRLIAPMVLGAILNPVNSSMIEVSLVPIGVAFGAPPTGTDSPGGILTLLAVSSQTIAVVGPTLGGLLIGLGGWRTIFSVNIPLSLACLALGAPRLPRTRPEDRRRSTVDIPGMVLFAGTLTALLLAGSLADRSLSRI